MTTVTKSSGKFWQQALSEAYQGTVEGRLKGGSTFHHAAALPHFCPSTRTLSCHSAPIHQSSAHETQLRFDDLSMYKRPSSHQHWPSATSGPQACGQKKGVIGETARRNVQKTRTAAAGHSLLA